MIHTIVIVVLVYAAVKATLRKLLAPKPYKMQLVSRTPATRESRGTIPNHFDGVLARMVTVEEPYQPKRARLELQRKIVEHRALMGYYPKNLKLET